MKFQRIFLFMVLIVVISACSNKAEDVPEEQLSDMPVDQPAPIQGPSGVERPQRQPLLGRLEDMKARFYETADFQTAETVNLAIDEIRTKDIEANALQLEDKIPMFTLPDATGENVNIADLLAQGPVVIMFYRGPWCPYCNLQLREMGEYVPYMNDIGASLVAISPVTPDSSLSMKERLELNYYVLSDSGNVVANNFGLVYQMPTKYKKMLDKKHHFKNYYGDDSGELPLTMTYVVDQSGTIRYNFGDSDYRFRAEPHEIMDILVQINEGAFEKNPPTMQ